MAKPDIESAFRIFPIRRDDWKLLGMFWENQYFVDLFLPSGLRYAPFKFNNISIAVAWILLHKCLISYVDLLQRILSLLQAVKHILNSGHIT